jgi:hypothetical protein
MAFDAVEFPHEAIAGDRTAFYAFIRNTDSECDQCCRSFAVCDHAEYR